MKETLNFETFTCAVSYLKDNYNMLLHEATQYVIGNSYKVGTDNRVYLPSPTEV